MLRKWIAKGLAIALCAGSLAPLSGEEFPIPTQVSKSSQK